MTDSAKLGLLRLGLGRLGWRGIAATLPGVVTVAEAIVAAADSALASSARLWDPGMAGTAVPSMILTPPIEIEARKNATQIGYREWRVTFPAAYISSTMSLARAQNQTAEAIEQLITAIDDDRTLDGLAEECRITDTDEPTMDHEQPSSPLVTMMHIEARWQERV